MKLIPLNDPEERMIFECPGCKHTHQVPTKGPAAWGFNNDMDHPTFTPSILVRWDYGPERIKNICHSFVTDGNIQFLNDCTHGLAGQTVTLDDIVIN